jgi:hypothetical protein
MNTSPSRVAAILASRGMEDLGAEMQRRLQYADTLARDLMYLREEIKELESLLPHDIREARKQDRGGAAAARRASHAGGRRAPAESDG